MNRLLIQVGGRRTEMFKNAKVGDKVWCMRRGWGVITHTEQGKRHPIGVKFSDRSFTSYTSDGKEYINDITPVLYWDELTIVPPKKPLPNLAVDTKVLVWDEGGNSKIRAHFHSFSEDGRIVTYSNGSSSFTGDSRVKCLWRNWELYEE